MPDERQCSQPCSQALRNDTRYKLGFLKGLRMKLYIFILSPSGHGT